MDWDPQSTDTRGFICPPCPVFHPTPEQFRNPLKYISSIRHIGEQAGICKIVPPAGWRPPFAINDKTFRFRTRVQQLNCLDGHSRAEGNFVEALRMFLYRAGAPMQQLPRVHGQLVNLRLLFHTVRDLGGFDAVDAARLWPQVVRRVGRTRSADQPDDALCAAYRAHYETCLLAFERHTEKEKAASSTLQTPEVGTKRSVTRADPTSAAAATPLTKTRSSMKKAARDSGGGGESQGGHTSSEENDAPVVGVAAAIQSDVKDVQVKTEHGEEEDVATTSKGPESLEPSALKPDAARKLRLAPPEIRAGQKFYRFFPEAGGAVLAQVKRVFGGKKPHVAIQYVNDGSRDDVDLATMQILVANGWDAEAAELAYKSEICQTCLRGDCWEKMLLCDGCNSGHHLFCLASPLDDVPPGDWYCSACVEEACASERASNPKFGFEMGSEYSVAAYKEKADAWKRAYFGVASDEEAERLSDLELEREYWRLLSIPAHEKRLEVEYGSDIDSGSVGSGFPRADSYLKCVRLLNKRLRNATSSDKSALVQQLSRFLLHGLEDDAQPSAALEKLLRMYAHDDWNLNNLPKLPGSVLQHLDEDIKGVMVPWIYMGMCFSTFCWHVEDHNFYSMSYNHCGAPKTWYGVPCNQADHFEETMRKLTPELFGSQPDLHLQLVTMFSPATLIKHGVPVYRATHRPNEFMVTFPSAYHGGFNNGFNCAEAVNFATVDWLPWGAKSVLKYRQFRKLPVFAHEALVWSLAETLVESSTFDSEAASRFLLPAMQQLYDDFVTFEHQVGAHGITAREWMAAFEERHHAAGGGSGAPVRSTKKRMMSTADCDDAATSASHDVSGGMRSGKMAALSTATGARSKMNVVARPTRMVLWAGQSGKHEGLRCVACKQYCYLQAVVCTKCRHNTAVGCVEHFSSMCECDRAEHYVYLRRYDAARIVSVLSSMRARVTAVQEWNEAYDTCFAPSDSNGMKKPSVEELRKLLADGRACGGASQDRLDDLESAIASAVQWNDKVEELLRSQERQNKQRRGSIQVVDIRAVVELAEAAEKLAVLPDKLERIESLLTRWRECERESELVFQAVSSVQRREALVQFSVRNPHDTSELWLENKRHQSTIASIKKILDTIVGMGMSRQEGIALRLCHARQYLDVLLSVNAAISVIATCIDRSHHDGERDSNSSSSGDGNPLNRAEEQAYLTESGCREVVAKADALSLEEDAQILKVEILRSFLQVTEAEAAELAGALEDTSKSMEELEALLNRLRSLPVAPDRLRELSDRLAKCQSWEAKAKRMVDLSEPVASRPTLQEVEEFYSQADACFVPTTSLLRRQIHTRMQDCRRWYTAVHSLFVKATETESSLSAFLQAAIAKFHATALSPTEHPHSRLHCVCEQVMPDKTNAITCQRCSALFHPQCVDGYSVAGGTRAGSANGARQYVCSDCQPKQHRSRANQRKQQQERRLEQPSANYSGSIQLRATLGSQGVPLFCHCRGAEDASMICCDFCDEWYHSTCIGMPFEVMNHIEAFRCQRCALKQGLYYLDKKALRKDFLGRRPAVARVDAFLAQLQTTLIALPPGALELVAYMQLVRQLELTVKSYAQSFAAEIAPHALAHLDFVNEEAKVMAIMHRVTDLEVALDAAQGSLGAIHWCLRACRMVLGCESAPKYAHLVVLLEDVKQPSFTFPCVKFYHIQLTIEDRVQKASRWLKQTKTLEVEEWNVEKARRLMREYRELSQFLELPVAEVNLVHQIVANADTEDDAEFVSDKRRRLV